MTSREVTTIQGELGDGEWAKGVGDEGVEEKETKR